MHIGPQHEEESNTNTYLSQVELYYGVIRKSENPGDYRRIKNMKDFIIGILLSAAVIILLESIKSLDKRLVGALTLVGIAFIYVGFAWNDLHSLIIVSISILLFVALSYYGQTKNFNLIVMGLLLHGVWDLVFPRFSSVVPKGYDIFCVTADFILAPYFYFRVSNIGGTK